MKATYRGCWLALRRRIEHRRRAPFITRHHVRAPQARPHVPGREAALCPPQAFIRPFPHWLRFDLGHGVRTSRPPAEAQGGRGKRLGMQRHSDPPCPLSEQKFLPSTRGYLAAALHLGSPRASCFRARARLVAGLIGGHNFP